jgi:glycosyltransferase involved in cell wall biosynthesis
MKIAILTTDNREPYRQYDKTIPWFGTAPEALLQGFAKLPEAEIHVVACTQRPMESPAKLASNIYFHSLHVPKLGWMRTGYLGCIRATRRKLREIGPDIVHGQGTERDCSLSAVFSGYPNVLTIHGNMRMVAPTIGARPFSFYWLAARLETLTIPRSNGVVCISAYTREVVKALAKQTWVIPNAVDGSFFDLKKQPETSPRILCVGNVDQRKNQNALIRALTKFPPKKPFELIFLGANNENNTYGKEFTELVTKHPWCRYEGFVDREGLKKQMASASGLVHPTLEESFGMVIVEAMASGVPVAASRVGGIPDLIRPEDTGLLFDPLDDRAMVTATMDLLTDQARVRATAAREEARSRFLPEIIARKHLEVYREVIKDR